MLNDYFVRNKLLVVLGFVIEMCEVGLVGKMLFGTLNFHFFIFVLKVVSGVRVKLCGVGVIMRGMFMLLNYYLIGNILFIILSLAVEMSLVRLIAVFLSRWTFLFCCFLLILLLVGRLCIKLGRIRPILAAARH